MKVISILVILFVFVNCGGDNTKIDKLKEENEQLKSQVQAAEKVQTETDLREKYLTAMRDIKSLGMFIESYVTDWSKPPTHNSFKEMSLDSKIVPFYIKQIPVIDPWGNEYHYKRSDEGEYGIYWIGCSGSDGIFNGFDQSGNPQLFAGVDIVFSNGEYKLSPK